MKLIYSKTCPGWVKSHIDAALAVMGCDPVRIGKHLDGLKNPHPDLRWHESVPGLFASAGLWLSYGTEDSPWLTVIPNGGEMNRDEFVWLLRDC